MIPDIKSNDASTSSAGAQSLATAFGLSWLSDGPLQISEDAFAVKPGDAIYEDLRKILTALQGKPADIIMSYEKYLQMLPGPRIVAELKPVLSDRERARQRTQAAKHGRKKARWM